MSTAEGLGFDLPMPVVRLDDTSRWWSFSLLAAAGFFLRKARSNRAKTTIDTTTAVEAATKIKIALTGALATGMPHIHLAQHSWFSRPQSAKLAASERLIEAVATVERRTEAIGVLFCPTSRVVRPTHNPARRARWGHHRGHRAFATKGPQVTHTATPKRG